MRVLITASVLSLVVAGCNGSTSNGSPPEVGTTIVSCDWGGTCDQYSGAIDPTFAANLQTTCATHGVAFATAPCPTASRVPGYCDLGTSSGVANTYFYYAPTYDPTTASAACEGNGVWVP
jgi:hypothetical protein